MAGNPIPTNDDGLLAMADGAADGLHRLEGTLGLTSITEAKVRADLAACHTAINEAGAAKDARQTASDAAQAADDAATAFLTATRNVLAIALGSRWSAHWAPTGFPDESTAVPRLQEKRLNLCVALKVYFSANPAREVAALNVTAAKAEEYYQALSDGRDLLAHTTTLQGQKLKARDVAVAALAKHLRTLISDLSSFLADDDERWHDFLLNAPADPVTPEPVTSLTLEPGTAGKIVASWPRAVRATRYRPFVQVMGVDADFVARDPVHDLTVTLEGFTAGQTVKVRIVAANDDGEAPAGPTEEILVP